MVIDKILVPVDFSDASQSALAYGIGVANEFEATLVITHVVEYSRPLAYAFPEETFELEKSKFEEVRTKLGELIPEEVRESLNYRFIVKFGVPEDELLASVSDESVDLIVMGTHGRRGFERWVLGSATEHLLRRVPVPIVTVSRTDEGKAARSLRRGTILYATDLSEGSRAGLEAAYGWARRFDANLVVLNVMLPLQLEYGTSYLPLDIGKDHEALHEELSEQMQESVPESMRLDDRVRLETGEGVPYEVILDRAQDLQADLLVINLHGKSRMERTLIGATAERVVRASRTPVLSIPVLDSGG